MNLNAAFEEELDRAYLEELLPLQAELLKLQQHIVREGQRLLVIFEGRDAAGKGGTILRFSQFLMPRYLRVVALAKPSEREAGQWYFQRYVKHLPCAGEVVLFDRSYYNRAVVEPVMGFCSAEQHQRFMRQVVPFEHMLIEDGMRVVKLWFSIGPEEQARRLREREANQLKRWKLSTVDREAQAKWQQFTRRKEAMFAQTSTPECPWIVVRGDDKKTARLESIRYVLSQFDYAGKGSPGLRIDPHPEVVGPVLPEDPGARSS